MKTIAYSPVSSGGIVIRPKKMKAVTFSYDDGHVHDIRMIKILNRYGLKCTFNLCSGLLGLDGFIKKEDVKSVYEGHEIASHTVHHPRPAQLSYDEMLREIQDDVAVLSEIAGYETVGFAYPYGTSEVTDSVYRAACDSGVKYARGTHGVGSLEYPDDMMLWEPTYYHKQNWDNMFALAERFAETQYDSPRLFYVMGHSHEFESFGEWDKFEEFCRLIGGRGDVFYGTNREVLGI